jgi:hypothetical protein
MASTGANVPNSVTQPKDNVGLGARSEDFSVSNVCTLPLASTVTQNGLLPLLHK